MGIWWLQRAGSWLMSGSSNGSYGRQTSRCCWCIGGRRGWGGLREWHWNAYTPMCTWTASGKLLCGRSSALRSVMMQRGGVGVRGRLERELVYEWCWCSVVQSCLTLCDPMDCSPPGSPSMGFSRQEDWSRVLCPPPGDLPNPGTEPGAPALQAGSLPLNHRGSPDICILTADSLCCAAETNTTL